MSDWDATYDGVAAVNNGLDLEMPSPKFMNAKNLIPAVEVRPGERIHHRRASPAPPPHRVALRIHNPPAIRSRRFHLLGRRSRRRLPGSARKHHAAQERGELLPLDPAKIKNIAIIGPNAYPAVAGGGGSSEAHAFEPVSILTGIANLLGPDAHVFYSAGMPDSPDEKQAVAMLTSVIVAVGFTPKTESEGHDRTFTLPPGQDALIEQVAAANPRTIVPHGGGGIDRAAGSIKSRPAPPWYPGQEGGTAVAQILFGQHNPEGKLPVSFDRSWDENPSAKWYYGDPKDNTTLHTIGEDGKPKDYTIEHINTATNSWSATATGPPPASTRCFPSASA